MTHTPLEMPDLSADGELHALIEAALDESGRRWERDERWTRVSVPMFSALAAGGLGVGSLLLHGRPPEEAEALRAWVYTLEGGFLGGLAGSMPRWWRDRRLGRLLARDAVRHGAQRSELPRA